ncbi:hypothetical protein [Streptomyces rimosus]|uniref:hypothetical protein n=1 Tax=Streptomyces rimosus TaxID=1927 RepID=UPI0037CF5894
MPVPGADVAPDQWHSVAPLAVAAARLAILLGGCLGWGAVPGCWALTTLMRLAPGRAARVVRD